MLNLLEIFDFSGIAMVTHILIFLLLLINFVEILHLFTSTCVIDLTLINIIRNDLETNVSNFWFFILIEPRPKMF